MAIIRRSVSGVGRKSADFAVLGAGICFSEAISYFKGIKKV